MWALRTYCIASIIIIARITITFFVAWIESSVICNFITVCTSCPICTRTWFTCLTRIMTCRALCITSIIIRSDWAGTTWSCTPSQCASCTCQTVSIRYLTGGTFMWALRTYCIASIIIIARITITSVITCIDCSLMCSIALSTNTRISTCLTVCGTASILDWHRE